MKKIMFFIASLILLSALASAATNQTAKTIIPDKEVYTSLYLLNLGKFDISTGSFTADFYLSFKCTAECPEINYEFMNGRASSTEKITDSKNEKFYRIQANLNSPVDLKKFPFDRQEMQIILEDKKLTSDKLIFIPEKGNSGIDESIVFPGWNIKEFKENVTEHEYKIYEENYSQYRFYLPIERIPINSIIKTFLPILFMVLVMLSSFILDIDKITTRLAMSGSALVGSVMFHVSLANQIPPVGYLTLVDKFMVLTYFVILMSFGFNVALLELVEKKQTQKAEKLHRATEYTMFIVVPLLYAILFFFLM